MKMSFRHCLLASAVVVSSLGFTASTQAALPFFSDKKDEVPSLAPMLEEATPAVVSIAVEGTQTSTQRVPEMFRYFFCAPQEQVQEALSEVLVLVSSLMPIKVMSLPTTTLLIMQMKSLLS